MPLGDTYLTQSQTLAAIVNISQDIDTCQIKSSQIFKIVTEKISAQQIQRLNTSNHLLLNTILYDTVNLLWILKS